MVRSRTQKAVSVAIADLDQKIFVREAMNAERAAHFAQLESEGSEIPPITINHKKVVIDGRTRIEAREINGNTHIMCVVEDITDEVEIIARAHELNGDGPAPSTPGDLAHIIDMLVERRVGKKRIAEMLRLPKGMANAFIDKVHAHKKQQTLNRARNAVIKGNLTIPAAAAEQGVDVADLKNLMKGRTKVERDALNSSMRGIRSVFAGLTKRVNALGRKSTQLCQDGLVSVHRVEKLFEDLATLRNKHTRVQADAKRRFVAATSSTDD